MISCLFPRGNKRRVNGGKSNRSMLSLFTKSTPCVFVPNFLFISQALSIYPPFVLLSRVYQTIKCECLITPELVMLSCVSSEFLSMMLIIAMPHRKLYFLWWNYLMCFLKVLIVSNIYPESQGRDKFESNGSSPKYIFDVTFQIHVYVPYLSITWRDLNPPICWLSNWLQAWRKSYYALMTSAALGLAQPWPRG